MPKTATTARTSVTHPRLARRVIPVDTEPLTAEDLKAIREADAAFARGDYCTLDDLKADFARHVARSRPHQDQKRPRPKVSR
jgi:hypothetical protein